MEPPPRPPTPRTLCLPVSPGSLVRRILIAFVGSSGRAPVRRAGRAHRPASVPAGPWVDLLKLNNGPHPGRLPDVCLAEVGEQRAARTLRPDSLLTSSVARDPKSEPGEAPAVAVSVPPRVLGLGPAPATLPRPGGLGRRGPQLSTHDGPLCATFPRGSYTVSPFFLELSLQPCHLQPDLAIQRSHLGDVFPAPGAVLVQFRMARTMASAA
ncbi:PREDICTED: uncharacterized protein LOC105591274 [Cercocebus atys]|uniref:uncharacterized protein LOC105591274 n=1 Tax=Cercocebus atys TaxID=9531 RepID=UPI0005F40A28|nr:PREDICTED: uncharacterized protein LOC105591274 [Cercocebus atys]